MLFVVSYTFEYFLTLDLFWILPASLCSVYRTNLDYSLLLLLYYMDNNTCGISLQIKYIIYMYDIMDVRLLLIFFTFFIILWTILTLKLNSQQQDTREPTVNDTIAHVKGIIYIFRATHNETKKKRKSFRSKIKVTRYMILIIMRRQKRRFQYLYFYKLMWDIRLSIDVGRD